MSAAARLRSAIGSRVLTTRARIRAERNLGTWRRDQRIPFRMHPDLLPVIFCTWRRLGRLERTLEMLAGQNVPVQALIWDNSGNPDTVARTLESAELPVTVHHSARNVGGFGRFYLAREAAMQGHTTVVFIDDDQDFGPGAISDLLSAHQPRTLSGWWAWRYTRPDCTDRVRAQPGEPAVSSAPAA